MKRTDDDALDRVRCRGLSSAHPSNLTRLTRTFCFRAIDEPACDTDSLVGRDDGVLGMTSVDPTEHDQPQYQWVGR